MMPPDDPELQAAWARLDETHRTYAEALEAVDELLDEGEPGETPDPQT